MEPEYRDDEIILVDPGKIPEHNSDVVVINGANEANFNRLIMQDNEIYLFALNQNPQGEIFELKEQSFIVGRVIFSGKER